VSLLLVLPWKNLTIIYPILPMQATFPFQYFAAKHILL